VRGYFGTTIFADVSKRLKSEYSATPVARPRNGGRPPDVGIAPS
jgi:hypothetical protein